MRMPSKLDPHLATIESWLATEPQITALAIVRRLAAIDPATFGDQQHSIVQRLIRTLRRKATGWQRWKRRRKPRQTRYFTATALNQLALVALLGPIRPPLGYGGSPNGRPRSKAPQTPDVVITC